MRPKYNRWDTVIYKPRGENHYILVKIIAIMESKEKYLLENYVAFKSTYSGDWLIKSQAIDTHWAHWDALEETALRVTNDNLESVVMLYL